MCLPRQVSVLKTDHGDTLAAVEHIGIDIDGLGRCASRRLDPHEACWLKAHGSPLAARLHLRCLVYVTGALRSSVRTIGSECGPQFDVAMLIAVPGCPAGVWCGAARRSQRGRMRPRALPCSPHVPAVCTRQDSRRVSHLGRLYVTLTSGLTCSLCAPVREARIEHKMRLGVG